MAETTLQNVNQTEVLALFGHRDENLRKVREATNLKVVARDGNIILQGDDETQVARGTRMFQAMLDYFRRRNRLPAEEVMRIISDYLYDPSLPRPGSSFSSFDAAPNRSNPPEVWLPTNPPAPGLPGVTPPHAATAWPHPTQAQNHSTLPMPLPTTPPLTEPANMPALTRTGEFSAANGNKVFAGAPPAPGSHQGVNAVAPHIGEGDMEIAGPFRKLRARSPGQVELIRAIRRHDVTFCLGAAGTGKTYLAVATALEAMFKQQIKRIVLVRPLVEAGEKLGYLPGDIFEKVSPFLRPLLDSLRDMLDFHQVKTYMDGDIIEIVPLAYMRGRTLNEAFIILDEAQNTTIAQMKLFLTRMGQGSKIVVTGDLTQVDLPSNVPNGLKDAVQRLERIPGIAVVRMQASDIVRHPMVEAIVNAYDQNPPEETSQPRRR